MNIMDLAQLRIDRLIDTQTPLFFRNPNIAAIGRGRKIVNGKMLNEPTLTFFVRKKVSSNLLHPAMIIPNFFMGSYTDVIEDGGEQRELTLGSDEPARASGAIIRVDENNKSYVATLTYFVTEDKPSDIYGGKRNIFILGSAHFLDSKNENKPGEKIYYSTSRYDERRRELGIFSKSVPRVVGEMEDLNKYKDLNKYNLVDAGLALIGPDNPETRKKIAVELIDGTKILGTTNVNPGNEVFKVGTTTGLTYGKVISVRTYEHIGSDSLKATIHYKDLIRVEIAAGHGDSGALGITKNGQLAFGQLNTASEKYTTFSRIKNVLSLLNAKFLE